MSVADAEHDASEFAPGALVQVRDETWVVSSVENTADGPLLTVRGVTPLVEGTTARFFSSIDTISAFRPEDTRLVADTSSHYVDSRLWLESMLRKTSLPVSSQDLAVVPHVLADPLGYQREAVSKALDPDRLRARLLIADAVGLGKTLEIGMILAELIRRGKGRRILVVTPRHVLEQMQHEMWTRFSIPFVRLDSEGVQMVKQKLPATRNPFTFFEKVIVSMDTLKQDRFVQDLRKHYWDAVVIDESHNVTNHSTQNHQLARTLAPNTDALILASATPHNGRKESFANQLSLLEPSSVSPDGEVTQEAIDNLMIRRHRYSPSVKAAVADDWAERQEPNNILAEPSQEEHAVAVEIAQTWTHPASGQPPVTGRGSKLFPWTLAKSFLSSPLALQETLEARIKSLAGKEEDSNAERQALERLRDLNAACMPEGRTPQSGKYRALVKQLTEQGVSPRSPERAVVFAERVPTLTWLRENLMKDLKLKENQIAVMHGGLTDTEQQRLVDSFKQASSPIRVLVTGDVASEGVNLHRQCHELIHYDIPWSLIRIEQRNGRIDRYGQTHPPRITTLLLALTDVEGFTGDIRVFTRLLEREREAHTKLGDVASIMGQYSGDAEEKLITQVLQGQTGFDNVVPSVETVKQDTDDLFTQFLALSADAEQDVDNNPSQQLEGDASQPVDLDHTGLFSSPADYLLDGLVRLYTEPERSPEAGGVSLSVERNNVDEVQSITLKPSPDLRSRFAALPQSYVEERGVTQQLRLTPSKTIADGRLAAALADTVGSSWPDTHYLSPLHPVLDWLADRSLATLERGEIFVVQGNVQSPTVLTLSTTTNRRGENISVAFLTVEFLWGHATVTPFESPAAMFASIDLNPQSLGHRVDRPEQYQPLIPQAIDQIRNHLESLITPAVRVEAEARVERWAKQLEEWSESASQRQGQRALFRDSQLAVSAERRLADTMMPDRTYVRPLLVVVPPEGD